MGNTLLCIYSVVSKPRGAGAAMKQVKGQPTRNESGQVNPEGAAREDTLYPVVEQQALSSPVKVTVTQEKGFRHGCGQWSTPRPSWISETTLKLVLPLHSRKMK